MKAATMRRCTRCDGRAVCWLELRSRSTSRVLAYYTLCALHERTERGLQATGCSMATAVFESLDTDTDPWRDVEHLTGLVALDRERQARIAAESAGIA